MTRRAMSPPCLNGGFEGIEDKQKAGSDTVLFTRKQNFLLDNVSGNARPGGLPPSRTAKRSLSFMAMSTMRVTSTEILLPGVSISLPSGGLRKPIPTFKRRQAAHLNQLNKAAIFPEPVVRS
jgi:hypothetical protein